MLEFGSLPRRSCCYDKLMFVDDVPGKAQFCVYTPMFALRLHIPRSFFKTDSSRLTGFEEISRWSTLFPSRCYYSCSYSEGCLFSKHSLILSWVSISCCVNFLIPQPSFWNKVALLRLLVQDFSYLRQKSVFEVFTQNITSIPTRLLCLTSLIPNSVEFRLSFLAEVVTSLFFSTSKFALKFNFFNRVCKLFLQFLTKLCNPCVVGKLFWFVFTSEDQFRISLRVFWFVSVTPRQGAPFHASYCIASTKRKKK